MIHRCFFAAILCSLAGCATTPKITEANDPTPLEMTLEKLPVGQAQSFPGTTCVITHSDDDAAGPQEPYFTLVCENESLRLGNTPRQVQQTIDFFTAPPERDVKPRDGRSVGKVIGLALLGMSTPSSRSSVAPAPPAYVDPGTVAGTTPSQSSTVSSSTPSASPQRVDIYNSKGQWSGYANQGGGDGRYNVFNRQGRYQGFVR